MSGQTCSLAVGRCTSELSRSCATYRLSDETTQSPPKRVQSSNLGNINRGHIRVLHKLLRVPNIPIDDLPLGYTDFEMYEEEYKQVIQNSLQLSCLMGRLDMAKELLAYGADVNAASKGSSALVNACQSGSHDLILHLLSAHAELDPPANSSEYTPLQVACQKNSIKLCHLLIDHGASLNHPNRYHATALIYAAKHTGPLSQFLISNGADVDVTSTGRTALHAASYAGALGNVKLLLNNGADLNAYAFRASSEVVREPPSKADGMTPLWEAVSAGKIAVVQHLRSLGAHVGSTSVLGRAAYNGDLP